MYRFAPSPSGDMHISDLRVALFNYICATQDGKQFVVRIEDGDKRKNIEGKDKEILDILAIFGINYDLLYYQSENFKYHLQFASSLMDKKKAFACFCTHDELETNRYSGKCLHISDDELLNNNLPFVIRIKRPDNKTTLDSFIIMKKEKYPTYNFACAVDDMIQGIKHIIRDEDHSSNTPKQKFIRESLGYSEDIKYTYLPAIQYKKNDENTVKELLDQGYMPEAIINYLIALGNETPIEIFSLTEAFTWFDLAKISRSSKEFDLERLKLINREQIKLIEDVELSKRIGYSCASIGKLAKLYTKECSTTAEIKRKIDIIFTHKTSDEHKDSLIKLKTILKDAPYFEEFDEFEKYLSEKSKLKGKEFFISLRILLTAEESGLKPKEIYPLIKNYLQEIAK